MKSKAVGPTRTPGMVINPASDPSSMTKNPFVKGFLDFLKLLVLDKNPDQLIILRRKSSPMQWVPLTGVIL